MGSLWLGIIKKKRGAKRYATRESNPPSHLTNILRTVAGFQQQFAGNPYGQVVPSSVAPQNFAPNYMMGGGMQGFPMNQPGMPQNPQMMQRLQQQQQAQAQAQQQQQQQQQHAQQQQQQQAANPAVMGQVSTPQRPPSAAQGTPNNALPSQQGQFPTPQPPSQSQTPTNQQSQQPQSQQQQQTQQAPTQAQGQQQPVSAGLSTPQTPTFSTNQGPAANGTLTAAPLSPGTESRDKERFALLLDINHELLYESIQIQATQQELKKESAAAGNPADKKPTEEETQLQQDYLQ